jgi:uncharacterized membrane protein YhaH (DUF805 family)
MKLSIFMLSIVAMIGNIYVMCSVMSETSPPFFVIMSVLWLVVSLFLTLCLGFNRLFEGSWD